MFTKLINQVKVLYRLYILRDPFYREVKRWFADQGDQALRLNYPLDKSSIVFDVGGYFGDYTEAIYRKFGCRIYLFEPVPSFLHACTMRFRGNSSIICLNYGLSSESGWFEINLNHDGSSFKKAETGGILQQAEVRSITEVVTKLKLEKIDLMKINIEGGEFDLLPAIINSGLIKRIKYLQVQFHNFDDDAAKARLQLRGLLEQTHREMWCYEFVWESWELL